MKQFLFASILLVTASSLATVMAQAKKPISKQGLPDAVRILFEAVKANDLDNLKTFYAADYTFTGPDGKMVIGDERLRTLKELGQSNFVSASDLKTRIYGEAGVVTGVVTMKNSAGGNEQNRFHQVWNVQGGTWRLVATQVTRIE